MVGYQQAEAILLRVTLPSTARLLLGAVTLVAQAQGTCARELLRILRMLLLGYGSSGLIQVDKLIGETGNSQERQSRHHMHVSLVYCGENKCAHAAMLLQLIYYTANTSVRSWTERGEVAFQATYKRPCADASVLTNVKRFRCAKNALHATTPSVVTS